MEAPGVPYKHLKHYTLALQCDSRAAAIGRRHNKVSTARIEAAQETKHLKAQRKLAAQRKYASEILLPITHTDCTLEISPITDAQNLNMTIT